MKSLDEEALICDLAEVYRIYDYKKFDLNYIAILAKGLRDNSRIKMKLSGESLDDTKTMLAGILDRLTLILYSKTKDAEKGRNYPKLILDKKEKQEDIVGFYSSEDFEKQKKKILEGGGKWQQN